MPVSTRPRIARNSLPTNWNKKAIWLAASIQSLFTRFVHHFWLDAWWNNLRPSPLPRTSIPVGLISFLYSSLQFLGQLSLVLFRSPPTPTDQMAFPQHSYAFRLCACPYVQISLMSPTHFYTFSLISSSKVTHSLHSLSFLVRNCQSFVFCLPFTTYKKNPHSFLRVFLSG